MTDLPADSRLPEPPLEDQVEDLGDENDGILDRLRESPVGTNDPGIVGDAGSTDIPPGSDPGGLVVGPGDGGGGDPGPEDI